MQLNWKRPSKGWIVAGVVAALVLLVAYRAFFFVRQVEAVEVRQGALDEELHGPGMLISVQK